MDIVVWLRSLGLRKYEAAFRENEIDETVLPNLTAEDLKDLGVFILDIDCWTSPDASRCHRCSAQRYWYAIVITHDSTRAASGRSRTSPKSWVMG